MRRSSTFLLAILSTLLLSSCEPPGNPVAPAASGESQLLSGTDGLFTRVGTTLGLTLQASELIGSAGGTVALFGHSLSVPAGAVSQPTVFTITQLPTGYLEVDLRALVVGLWGTRDVGSGGFQDGKRVRFRMSYAAATGAIDPSRLVILRLLDDGGIEEIPTSVDPSTETVVVDLEHFSRYCMAMD